MNLYCLPFKQISDEKRSIVGEKAFLLAKLQNLGFNVPKATVVTTTGFEDFLSKNGLKEKIDAILNQINFDDFASVQNNSRLIRELISSAQIPGQFSASLKESYKKLGLSDDIENLEGIAKNLIDASR